ncbi:protein kinase domain-containing protein [Thermogemmatispora carboxidivorans]|uniref:protein kinase domain-containing protein n=1 Tax=Thermogemmatispora carboxidivorans TaxID=1382306 RepID=UPI0009DDC4DF|nr:protein kinase [Thermogemmatispora carboxidivorans]
MLCPRCHAQWDGERRACLRCGFVLPVASGDAVARPAGRERPHWSTGSGGRPPHFHVPRVTPVAGRHAGGQQPPVPPVLVSEAPRYQSPAEQLRQHRPWQASGGGARQEPTTLDDQRRTDEQLHERERQGVRRSSGSQPSTVTEGLRSLQAGELLQGGRYRLAERQGRHEWLAEAYETFWLAHDARRGGAPVRICEFVLPREDSRLRGALVRSAASSLHAAGRHTQIPTLLDVFSEAERDFFVFEHVEGESLLLRLRRRGRPLGEQEVVECCLQMVDVLEFLASQTPPIVHGLIRPDYIIAGRTRSHYVLTGFSVMLASGATQFVTGMARAQLSPYTAPELTHGVIDSRIDLYALLATAYHLATGCPPARSQGRIPPARQLNPALSPGFEAVLTKGLYSGQGLRPDLSQRYQHPAQLREALTERTTQQEAPLRVAEPHAELSQSVASEPRPPATEPLPDVPEDPLQGHPILQSLAPSSDLPQHEESLLPAPEELPPLPDGNDYQRVLLWGITLFLSLALTIALARGWF